MINIYLDFCSKKKKEKRKS